MKDASALDDQTLLAPQTRTSTTQGSAVDTLQHIGRLKVVQMVGLVGGTNPTLDGKIQDSADGSTGWADVAGATFVQVTGASNTQAIGVTKRGIRRYIRWVGTIAGTTPQFVVSVLLVAGKKRQ